MIPSIGCYTAHHNMSQHSIAQHGTHNCMLLILSSHYRTTWACKPFNLTPKTISVQHNHIISFLTVWYHTIKPTPTQAAASTPAHTSTS
jgi:hypothetical protein